jgi:hypothetical protein
VSAVTTAAVPSSPAAAVGRGERVQWLAPAPLWDEATVAAANAGIGQPWIAELTSDAFVAQFLAMVGGTDGSAPDGLAGTRPEKTAGNAATGPFRLFQPLSQRYYIVSASLICRRPGIPDRQVRKAKGEKTTFVMRLLADDGSEQAFIPAKGAGLTPGGPPTGTWRPAAGDVLADSEKQYPMHAAPVAPFAPAGSTAATLGMADGEQSVRTVFYGYIPAGGRERLTPPIADPVGTLKSFGQQPGHLTEDPFVDELIGRVAQPWAAQRQPPLKARPPGYPSLFLLLDLDDWLRKYVPAVHAAITGGPALTSQQPEQAKLLAQLGLVNVLADNAPVTLPKAIAAVDGNLALLSGADEAGPATAYDLTNATLPSAGGDLLDTWLTGASGLRSYAQAALDEAATGTNPPKLDVPPELRGMIKNDPVTVPAGTPQQTFIIRAVFEHDPCRPVLSAPSHPFALARAVDADAPARHIRIQLPDVTHLRAFNRGVALEMPPSLRRVMDAVTPDALKGDINPSGSLQLGMICSFSLQIIFLCAFIVMFIFLLVLNIVFWWMPFLKICFPVPVQPTSPKGPTP